MCIEKHVEPNGRVILAFSPKTAIVERHIQSCLAGGAMMMRAVEVNCRNVQHEGPVPEGKGRNS